MKLPKIAIKNYQFVLIIVFLGVLIGILSYLKMPRSEDPVTKFPIYVLVIVYPGTSPTDLEELIVDPLEEVINEVEDIEEIRTTIEEGVVSIRVESSFSIDIDDKFDEIAAAINTVRGDLPQDIVYFNFEKASPLETSIFQFALSSEEATYEDLYELAEDLETSLEQVNGVRTIEIEAYPEQQIRIALDFQKIANMNIPLKQVIGILQGNNQNIPGGSIDADTKSFNIQTSGGYENLESIRNTVVNASPEGGIIYLKDIAEVNFDYEDDKFIARYQKEKTVYVSVTQKDGYNILSLSEKINEKVESFQEDLPKSVKLTQVFTQAPAVEKRLNDFFINLIQGVLLIGVIIFVFLGLRSALVIMTVIPTSVIIAIGVLDFSAYGLQQISIAGLVIALGLLVDNGIVVVENITRFLKEGHSLKEAAYKGTAEVGWAIISSTVTTLLAFFPLTQLQNASGSFLRSLPLIVIYTLIASLILALTFTPLLASIFLKDPKKKEDKPENPKKEKKKSMIDRFLSHTIEKVYRPVLLWAMKKPIIIIVSAVLIFIGSFAIFPLVGVSLFPTADKPLLLIDIETPEGTNLDKTMEAALYVENVLDTIPLVKDYTNNVGHGNPQIYYNRIPVNFKKNYAQFMVNLNEWESESFYGLINILRDKFTEYKGARITVSELKNGPPSEAPIAIRVIGENFDTLKTIAAKVEKVIEETEGTTNVDNPSANDKIDLKVNINKDKAGLIGLSIADIDIAVRASLTGVNVGKVNFESGDSYDMVIRLPFDDKITMDDFRKIYIPTITGDQVPLSQVADIEFEAASSQILHYNLERNNTVTADVLDNYNVNEVTQEVLAKLETIKLPKGYSFYIAGELEAQQDAFGDLGQILIAALIIIFAVLVLQFKSFTQPLIVFAAIPLAFVGSILALFITGWSFSFFAFVGFTSLVGIVINTSIILVDYTNQLLAKGIPLEKAVQQACETRFTPIFLTTLTTILGLLPLTLTSSGLWSPLGWTIIGGMISSTFLTLLVVPLLYKWFTKVPKKALETTAA